MNGDLLAESERMITAKSAHSLPLLGSLKNILNERKVVRVSSFHNDDTSIEERRVATASSRVAVETCMQGITHFTATTDFDIRDMFWYTFPKQKFGEREPLDSISFLILVGDKDIECVTKNRRFPFQLPFKVSHVLPSFVGLIIERESHPNEDISSQNIPHVFSLSHPYNEILPVLCNHKDLFGDLSYAFTRPGCELVGVAGDFLMVYDSNTSLNMVYRVRKSDESEWQCARRSEIRRLELSTPKHAIHTPDRNSGGSCTVTPVARGMLTRSMTATALAKVILNKPTPQRTHMGPVFTPKSVVSQHSLLSAVESPWAWRMKGTPLSMPHTPYSLCGGEDTDLPGTWYSEMCLDFIWSESSKMDKPKGKANKMFLSSDFVSYTYINYFIPDAKELRSLRIIQQNVVTALSGPVIYTPCQDAASVEDEGLTVVLSLDGTMHLYSGTTRLCLLVRPTIATGPIVSVNSAGSRGVLLGIEGSCELYVSIPSMFWAKESSRIWESVLHAIAHEKALKMACEYRLWNTNRIDDVHKERRSLLLFIVDQMGCYFHGHPLLSESYLSASYSTHDFEEEGVVSKQKRPIRTPEQNMRLVDTNRKSTDPEFKADTSSIDCMYEVNPAAPHFVNSHVLLIALHALYEDCKLRRSGKEMKGDLLNVLYAISRVFKLKMYSEYYLSECSDLMRYRFEKMGENDSSTTIRPSRSCVPTRRSSFPDAVFSVYDTISDLITTVCPPTLPPSATHHTAVWILAIAVGLHRVVNQMDLQRLLGKNWGKRLKLNNVCEKVILGLISEKTISTAIRCERVLRFFGVSKWDVSRLPSGIGLVLGDILLRQDSPSELFHQTPTSPFFKSHPTCGELRRICSLRWPHDVRVDNVEGMLSSNRPVYIPITSQTGTEADVREQQEKFVLSVAIRTMTQAFGRALLHFRTDVPAPNDVICVREMCFGGRTYPGNRPIELNIGEMTDITAHPLRIARDWGNFYNGVATALRVKGHEEVELLGEWIQMSYHENLRPPVGQNMVATDKNQKPSATAAGVLFAFGLNGHLPTMNIFNVHEMLTQQDQFTSVALILGYAISKARTGDEQVNRILVTHLSFLMGPTMLEVNIEPIVQTSALVALGILFAEKAYKSLINALLNEMGKAPQPEVEPTSDRYSYTLATGFAIGLIGLCQGETLISQVPFVESRPNLIQRLLVLMEGGPRTRCVFNTDPIPDLTQPFEENGQPKSDSNHTKEINDHVNVHLTGHPATIALGLLFMKTGNKEVEFVLRLPRTMSSLEEIRPDLIPVRVLCRALVMWDDIEATTEWIDNQVPDMIFRYAEDSIGITNPDKRLSVQEEDYWDDTVDRETVAQTYIYAVAGSCFALALKYVATHNQIVKKVIWKYLTMLLPETRRRTSHERLCRLADKGAVAIATNMMIAALAILMAGSGDLDVLRVCRMIRKAEPVLHWYKNNCAHSTQMTVHMTMGMLFMGYSRYNLRCDNLSIASLIISFYPISSYHIADNRLFLQPLRFLWALAAERRLITTVDAKTEQLIQVPVEIVMKDNTTLEVKSPFHLPPFSEMMKVTIGGGVFEILTFDLSNSERADVLKTALEKHHGRLPVMKIKPEPDVQSALSACGLSSADFLQISEDDERTELWKTELTTGTSDSNSAHWQLSFSSAEADLEDWMMRKNAFPLKQQLHDLHKEVLDCDNNQMCARDIRLAATLSQAKEDTRAVGQHMTDRLLDILKTYADLTPNDSLNADSFNPTLKKKCDEMASALGPLYRQSRQTFTFRSD